MITRRKFFSKSGKLLATTAAGLIVPKWAVEAQPVKFGTPGFLSRSTAPIAGSGCAFAGTTPDEWWLKGDSLNDSSTNGLAASTAPNSYTSVAGNCGTAFSFNGTNQYVLGPLTPWIISQGSAHSYTAWVYLNSVTSAFGQVVMGYGGFTDAIGYMTCGGVDSTGLLCVFPDDVFSGDSAASSLQAVAGVWMFMAWVTIPDFTDNTSGTAFYLAIPGSLALTSQTINAISDNNPITTPEHLYVGTLFSDTFVRGFWNGYIRDVQVHNETLTPTQVAVIYNGGVP